MHFHLPKPLHGWRQFLGEVGIIVIGVLVALMAEQVVEALHWRGKLLRAEDAMRRELAQEDGPQAYARMEIAPCLDAEIARIHDGAGHVPAERLRTWVRSYLPPFRTWDSEAWKAVLASDVGSHMGSERLLAWSSPYRIIPGLTDVNQHESELTIDMREAVPPSGDPSAGDIRQVRRLAAQLRAANQKFLTSSELVLSRIGKLGAQVPVPVQRALLRDARAMFGACVRAPDLDAAPRAASLRANLRSRSLSLQ
jgi:hypothetical protein